MVKYHSDSERKPAAATWATLSDYQQGFFYMHHPTDRIAHTVAFVTPVMEHWLERKIAQLDHPMKDRSDDPSHHEQALLPQSYISLQIYKVILDNIRATQEVFTNIYPRLGGLHTIMSFSGSVISSWWTVV